MDLIKQAMNLRWPRYRIVQLVQFSLDHNLPITDVFEEQIVLDHRWVTYRFHNFKALQEMIKLKDRPGTVEVWGDGSGTTFDKSAGIGVVIDYPVEWNKPRTMISENIGNNTNNAAEISAIWRGMQEVPDLQRPLRIRSDSEFALGAISLNWGITKNVDLIHHTRKDFKLRKQVTFEHIKGHSGIEQNELCDRLAKRGRLEKNLNDY